MNYKLYCIWNTNILKINFLWLMHPCLMLNNSIRFFKKKNSWLQTFERYCSYMLLFKEAKYICKISGMCLNWITCFVLEYVNIC